MQKKKGWLLALWLMLLPMDALANSSWMWFTKTRPHDLLPLTIVLTIILESLAIQRFGGVKSLGWAIGGVLVANLVSFLVPWALEYSSFLYSHWNTAMSFDAFLSKTPHYQVTMLFLLLTLLLEIPALYLLLRNRAENRKRLLMTAAGANVATTVICTVLERMLCRGHW